MRRIIPHHDHGASITEYAAVTLLVAGLATALLASSVPGMVGGLYETALCQISGESGCEEDEPHETASPPDPQPETFTGPYVPDESTRVEPTFYPVEYDPGDGSEGAGADEEPEEESFEPGDGVGPPLEDPDADPPSMPEFEDKGESAGPYGSEEPDGLGDRAYLTYLREKYYFAAHVGGGYYDAPHAQEYLLHFLSNTGEDVELPVDSILEDVPSFQETIDTQREEIGLDAVQQAQEEGADEPMTFPVSADWESAETDMGESPDWHLALGTWQYGQTGSVTVYPPDDPDGEWTYEVDTEVHVAKEYDWDPNKDAVGPGGMFDQQELADLHTAGWAQEFSTSGSTTPEPYEGTA